MGEQSGHGKERVERSRKRRFGRVGAIAAVALLHAALGLWLGHLAPESDLPNEQPVFVVELIPPVLPPDPPPPPPIISQSVEGGGAPAAPSVVRPTLPRPKMPDPEVVPPQEPAKEQPLVLGASNETTPTPGMGQGGSGDGTGRGQGSGRGDGSGTGPRFLKGPTTAELRALHPTEAFRRRQGGRVTLNCRIRLDTRIEDCSVVEETPQGMGFGDSALAAARYFRFEAPSRGGQSISGAYVRIGVEWP